MATKKRALQILASSNDVVNNFANMYQGENGEPPAVIMESVTENIDTSTVPTARYTSKAYYEREASELWHKVWQVVCWGGDIPNPGDTKLYDNEGISAIIVRQHDGSLKAFYNSCLHRGMRLCSKEGNRRKLACRFHGYAWDTQGQCQNIPQAWDFPQLNKEDLSLPELAVDEWQGFIFVHPNADAEPLEEFLGGLSEHWERAGWSFKDRFKAVHVSKRIRCNWKVAQEAFMEAYHGEAVHPETIIPSAPFEAMRADVYPGERHYTRGLGAVGVLEASDPQSLADQQAAVDHYVAYYTPEFAGRVDLVVSEEQSARDIMHRLAVEKSKNDFGADLSSMSRFDVIDYCYFNVFPNFMPWPTLGYPLAYWFRPDGAPDSCTMEIMFLMPFGEERPPSVSLTTLDYDDPCEPHLGPVGAILDEDMVNLPLIQQGLAASKTGVINLSQYFESRVRHFHRTLGEYVPDQVP